MSVGAAIRDLAVSSAPSSEITDKLHALRLLRVAAWLVASAYLACLILGGAGAPVLVIYTGEHLALLVFAVCAWVAIARHHLLDARTVVDRSIRFAALTTVVLAVYVATLELGRVIAG